MPRQSKLGPVANEKLNAMNATHFTRRPHYDGEAFGPFGFLNPTTRKYALPSQTRKKAPSQESSQHSAGGGTPAHPSIAKKDEIHAEDVLRKWRTRDNRKGKLTPDPEITIANINWMSGDVRKAFRSGCYISSSCCHQLKRSKKLWI